MVRDLGGVSVKADRYESYEMIKTYSIEFFSITDYVSHNKAQIEILNTENAIKFLDNAELQSCIKVFAENFLSGRDLLKENLHELLEEHGLNCKDAQLCVEAVKRQIEGKRNYLFSSE